MELVAGLAAAVSTVAPVAAEAAVGAGGWITTVTPAAAAVAAPAAGLGLGSVGLGVLAGMLTAGQAVGSVAAGLAGRADALTTAHMYEADATSEGLASQAKAIEIRKRALTQIASNRVAFSASGIDISAGGSPEALEQGTERERDYQLEIERENGRIAAMRSNLQASAAKSRAQASLITGYTNAAGAVGRAAIDIARRG